MASVLDYNNSPCSRYNPNDLWVWNQILIAKALLPFIHSYLTALTPAMFSNLT